MRRISWRVVVLAFANSFGAEFISVALGAGQRPASNMVVQRAVWLMREVVGITVVV